MPTEDKSALIYRWLNLINKKPNQNCKFFWLGENEKAIIIDLEMMPTLLMRLVQLDKCEKKFLFVDMFAPKNVRFFGFDIDGKSRELVNEVKGHIPFFEAEDALFTFLEDHAAELSKWHKPYTSILDEEISREKSHTNIMGPGPLTPEIGKKCSSAQTVNYPYTSQPSINNYSSYNSSYKEREDFIDKLYFLVKCGRSSLAIDYVNSFLEEKVEDKDLVNAIYKMIVIDKLDLFVARQLLLSTNEKKDLFSDRKIFAEKFKEFSKRVSKPRGVDYATIL